MLTPQTIAYLKQCKMLLKTYEEVETELRMHNWDDHSLEEVRQWYYEPINEIHDAHTHGHNVRLWKILIIGSALTVWSVISILLLLVAYEKISTGRENIDRTISNFIVGLPFMPKTVRYVLEHSIAKSSAAKKATLDVSVALDYDGLNGLTGLTSFDAAVNGPFDFTNVKKPQMSFNISITKDFNMDLRLKNSMTYFKVNKLPIYVTALLGSQAEIVEKYKSRWISYDTTPLETEARKSMDTLSPQKSPTEKLNEAIYTRLIKKQILPRIKMEKLKEADTKLYKLHLDITKDLVNTIEDELTKTNKNNVKDDIPTYGTKFKTADYIDTSYVDMWINANDYYISKIVFSVKTKELGDTSSSSSNSLGYIPGVESSGGTVSMVLAIAYSDYGKDVTIEVPADAITFEDFYKEITNDYINKQNAIAMAARVKYDISTIQYAAIRYYTRTGSYPETITQLVNEGELTADFEAVASTERIYLQALGPDKIIIYSLVEDPSNTAAPYAAIVVSAQDGTYIPYVRNYTKIELSGLIGMPIQ